MAKRKAPAKRKRSTKKPDTPGSSTGIILVVIMLVVIGAAWYWKTNGGKIPSLVASSKKAKETNVKPEPAKDTKKKQNQPTDSPQKSSHNQPDNVVKRPLKEPAKAATEEPTDYNHYYYTTSFDFAWPAYTQDDLIVEHEGYAMAYNEENEQPAWVAYKLTAKNLSKSGAERRSNYREDSYVRTGCATLADYAGSGYDKGHLAPAEDFSWSQEAIDGTFLLSNISPQRPSYNKGIWKTLENKVREWTTKDKELFVITGPVMDNNSKTIGHNKVAVPSAFYKLVLDISEPGIKAIGFLIPHTENTGDAMNFAMTIDAIEKVTGLDFFPMMPDDLEKKLEASIDKKLWK